MGWREDVVEAFKNLGGEADLAAVYQEIRRVHPDQLTPTYEATIRQMADSS